MITAIDDTKLNALINKAMEIDTTYKAVNFKNYFFINCPAEVSPEALLKSSGIGRV
ncbi:MAG: hypothetical protein IPG39_21245 [Bacteroidetes bacterium]|nr:hypothetical protein [Bacteroidota bacterium]